MLNSVQVIKSIFADHDDFFIQEEQFDQTAIFLIGFKTLIDFTKSNLYIRQMAKMSSTVHDLFTNLSDQLDVDTDQIIKAVVEGKLVLLSDKENNAVLEPVSRNLSRSIDQPNNESIILGPMDAFGEDIDINVGLLRKWLSTERLCHCSYQVGELAKRRISMLYIKGKASSTLIEKVDLLLKRIEADIETVDDLNKHFGQRKFNPVSYLFSTEIPNQAIDSLKKNRIVLFLDNYPFALVFPHLFLDMLSTVNDRNFPHGLSLMIRILRGLGTLATLILPALYVALTSVNPDVLKIDLAFFISESREGIPLTPIIETLAMVVIVDLIIEAIVRLPKSVGPAITMVGGIILGQAMVEAKLVSNLLVIVITAMLIASSSVIGVQNSLYIRALKYPILILASVFGILGVFVGLTFVCIYLASLTSCDIPYMTFRIKGKGDTS
ncbi:spore germination protein [Paenibacillus chondroitinus]|uniref:Spore germination protein n=1 Tax=Paenibacillus chondroitinus TaxID=59842 RepID=A0ABU6DF14_9BACL|nr:MULTISPECIES: spore germination protein [Paenibacillus]MCY9659319.1 spore germination protein [Paenibacillus anseongense]MEB4796345.1 spore germination protein [Paenibacillus chondroitinus]